MLGHKLFEGLSECGEFNVYGTARNSTELARWFDSGLQKMIKPGVDAENLDYLSQLMANLRPDFVINCIGIVKQAPEAKDHLRSININSLFPHRIAFLCSLIQARLIHISTDCVFDGIKGMYVETDHPNPLDLYGRSKLLGELMDYPRCLTLRTSMIGHELKGKHGLIEWMMAQKGIVNGYTNAIFSGFPTVELTRIIRDYVIPNDKLTGLYHVSAEPISKFELLKLVNDTYQLPSEVLPFDSFYSDRSLVSKRFREATGYYPPSWSQLIRDMYNDFVESACYHFRSREA